MVDLLQVSVADVPLGRFVLVLSEHAVVELLTPQIGVTHP